MVSHIASDGSTLLDQRVQLPRPGKGGADIIMIVERDTSHILSG